MKKLPTYLALLLGLCLGIPATGLSKDRHRGHDHHRGHHDHHKHRHHHYRHYSPSLFSYGYRPYPYYSSYYSYPYGYGAYPYYYGRPSIGLSFTTAPRYTTYSRTVRAGDYDDELAVDVQRALVRRGYYRGSIDGVVGAGTRGAIREYQYRNRLEVTGRIDRSLLRSLGVG